MKIVPVSRLDNSSRQKTNAVRLDFRSRMAILLFGFLLLFPNFCRAQDSSPTEYELKAAFIYNFVKFVDWPSRAFVSTNSDYVIGILGENKFGDDLKMAIKNKTIKGRHLRFEAFQSVAEAENCQLLFVSASEKYHFGEILAALRGKPILTVSDTSGFLQSGGMINFKIVDNRIRFEINNASAKSADLTISSDLLNLAVP